MQNFAQGSCTAASTEAATKILHTMCATDKIFAREFAESKNWYLFCKFLARTFGVSSFSPKYRNSKSEIPDSRSDIRDSGFEIRDPRSEIPDPRSETRDPRSEIRESRSEMRDSRSEIQDPRSEIRDLRSEIRDPRFEIRDPRCEIRDPRFEIRDPRSEIRDIPAGPMTIVRFDLKYGYYCGRTHPPTTFPILETGRGVLTHFGQAPCFSYSLAGTFNISMLSQA